MRIYSGRRGTVISIGNCAQEAKTTEPEISCVIYSAGRCSDLRAVTNVPAEDREVVVPGLESCHLGAAQFSAEFGGAGQRTPEAHRHVSVPDVGEGQGAEMSSIRNAARCTIDGCWFQVELFILDDWFTDRSEVVGRPQSFRMEGTFDSALPESYP
jgi:hypothetical protein